MEFDQHSVNRTLSNFASFLKCSISSPTTELATILCSQRSVLCKPSIVVTLLNST